MRFIKILSVLALLIVSKFAFAQIVNLETVSYPFAPKENGVILLNYNQPTTIHVAFTVSRILSGASGTWPDLPIKAEIALFILSDVPDQTIDVINISTSDWYGPTYTISKTIEKDIVIPAGAVTLAKPNTSIVARWRFYKEGYPSPYNTNGWTDWVEKKYTSMKLNPNQIPTTTFNGPNVVCNEEIYTITNPYTITLENASGIATLTALGNNQWKVTRIGTASGPINLVSTFNGKVYKMNIHVGPMFQGQIDGDVALKRGWSRDYSLFATGGPYTNYKWTISDNRITMVPNGTTVKLSVPVSYQVSDPMEGDWITLKCTMNSECGPVSTSMQINIMPL